MSEVQLSQGGQLPDVRRQTANDVRRQVQLSQGRHTAQHGWDVLETIAAQVEVDETP